MHVCFWDKPLDDVLPGLATFARSMDLDTQTDSFRRNLVYSQFEYSDPAEVKPLVPNDEKPHSLELDDDYFTMRLLQLEGCEDVSVFQSSMSLGNLFVDTDPVGKYAKAKRYEFLYKEFEGIPFWWGFTVRDGGDVIRSVFGHGSENNPKHGRWQFNERGLRQPWEIFQSYTSSSAREKFNDQSIIECMAAVGLNYDNYVKDRFVRVIEFNRNGTGKNMVRYDDDARAMAEEWENYVAALKAEFKK